jgi:hypothetical protein
VPDLEYYQAIVFRFGLPMDFPIFFVIFMILAWYPPEWSSDSGCGEGPLCFAWNYSKTDGRIVQFKKTDPFNYLHLIVYKIF